MKKNKQAPKARNKPRVDRIQLPAKKAIRVRQNGVSRPTPTHPDGSPKITARVWQIADEISAKHAAIASAQSKKTKKKVEAKPATRQEVLAATKKEKIKYSTFVNQFYAWRRFNGLQGRIRKDGTKALPQGPGNGQEGKKLDPRRGYKKPGAVRGRPKGSTKKLSKPGIGAKTTVRVAKAAKKTKPKAKKPVSAPAPVEIQANLALVVPVVANPEPKPDAPKAPFSVKPPFPVSVAG